MTFRTFTYERYDVFKVEPDGSLTKVASVEAQSAEQAVYRMVGGAWGRADYVAKLEGEE